MFGALRSQQAKAIGLTLLIVMLAQTAYSNGMLGWSYPERFNDQSDSMGSIACNTATLGSNDPIHVDRINGSDVWAGTVDCPKASIASAVGNASAGDEIIVHAGIYHENITIDNKDNLLLRAASGERVVMDGTRSISDDFDLTWDIADGSGIQEVALPQSGWQLFLSRTEQVPARWPNAAFSNNSVFNRTYWAEGTLTNSNNAYTLGWLQDAGPESGIHDGLNETINATGLDPVGAIAILNVGSFKSYSREITSWNPSNGTFGYDGTGMSWKTKHHAYFLEGKRELIDMDGEWWLNSTNNRLHYRPPSGQDANDLDLRVKVQPFAITVQNSDGVSIEGIDFFGTTIKVDQCDECTFANSTLEYPSTSRRSQGIAGESADERFVTHFYRSTNTLVDAVSITNTDGAAIEFHGAAGQSNGNIVNNSYFHAIDWSASDQKGLMTTIYEGGRDMTFSNNTVHLTGASSVLSIGDSPTVLYNEVWDVGHLQTDGAVVQLMQGEVQGSEIAYNWIHDIGKYGIRFDAPIGQSSTGNNGSIHHNVLWNVSGGIMAKGDYHDISNNTVFGNRVDGKNNLIILHESSIGNENSSIWNNAADAIAAHRVNSWSSNPLQSGTFGLNWNGYLNDSNWQIGTNILGESADDLFGVSVTLNSLGNRIAVGAVSNDGNGVNSGSVRIFEVNDGVWAQLGSDIDGEATNDWLGSSVSFNEAGNRIAIGAKYNDGNGADSGHTRIYEYTASNDTWWQLGSDIDGELAGDHSGISVSMNATGNRVVIGAIHNDGAGNSAGHARVFHYSSSNNTWWQLGNDIDGAAAGDQFGLSVAINDAGDRLVVGAYEHDTARGHAQVYQYTSSNNTWWQLGADIDGEADDDYCGWDVAISASGHRVVIGAILNDGGGIGAGHARIFEYTNSNQTWWQVGDDIDGQSAGDMLGFSVSISDDGNTIAAGSRWDDDGGTESGSAGFYRYTAANNTWWQIGQNVDGLAAQDSLGYDIALSSDGNRVVIGSPQNDQVGTDSGLIQTFVVSSDAESNVESMLVNVTGHDFRPKQGSQLDILSAGAYDAADNDPWDAGIEWTYSRSSNYTTGCMDSIALNYDPNAGFDDGSCRYLEADVVERVGRLNQAIEPITFTESLSNFDFGTWSTGVSNGTTTFSQSWRKPAGAPTDANFDFQDFAIAENGDQAIVFTQNHSGGSTPHSLALMYKPFNGSWSSSIIDNSTNTGFKPSIAIDRSGALHIAYIDNANDTIRYATNVSGSWAFSTLGDAEWTDSHSRKTDIAIDPITDAVYIVHTMKDVGDSGSALEGARFHTNEGGSWTNESITNRGLREGYDPQIALDSDGNIHVSYYLDQGSDLKIASRIDGVWQNETVYDSDNSGNTPAIAIDSQDVIHIIHMINHAANNKRLTLTSGTLGSWSNTTFGSNTLYRHSYNPSIAIDSNDAIHIAYHYASSSKHLHYISNMTGSWSLETLANTNAGWGARVSIDNNDDIHIAHSDLIGSGTIAHYLEMTKRTGSGDGLTAHPIFDISPPLPDGLSMNWRNGTITGTPTEVQDSTTYTVWANISERSASTSISIGVDWSLRPSVSGVSATLNTAITPITFEWNTTIWESRVTNGSDHPSSAINSNNAGKATDVAADSNGKTHVVSFDDNNDDLRYTTNAGGTWTSSLIHQSGNTGRHPSIVIDSNDMIHVVFVRQTGSSLMYMNKSVSATSWSSATTISSDAWNKATGLALDEDDNLYVSWARSDANYKRQCFVKTKPVSSSTWSDLPDLYSYYQSENHRVRSACDVAVDSNKKVHIIAHDATSSSTSGDLRYTTNVSGSWVSSDVRALSTTDTGRLVQIAIDSNDKIHLSYTQGSGSTYHVYHDTNVGGSWSQTQVVWGADHPAIAIDSNDDVYIVVGDSGGISGYRRAASSSGSFSYSTGVSCTGGCDEYTSVVADNNDDFHISFARHLNNRLGVSYEQGTGKGVKNDPGSWRPVISSISSCEVSPSLPQGISISNSRCTISGTPSELSNNQTYTVWANTSSGDSYSTQVWLRVVQSPPNISYNSNNFILTNNTTMSPSAIPTNSGGSIPHRNIDSGSVGKYSSIAIDSNGNKHISYRNHGNGTLSYATDASGSWVTTTVDSTLGSGWYSSIALDSNDSVHIAHYDNLGMDLEYTTNKSGSWVTTSLDSSYSLGWTPSIVIDSNDNVHIAYLWLTWNIKLRYATDASGSWVYTDLSPTTGPTWAAWQTESDISLALDSNDNIYAAYSCGTYPNRNVCVATNASGTWTTSDITSSSQTGYYPSLSIDSSDYLHISYYDDANDDLKYSTNASGSWVHTTIDQTGDVGLDSSMYLDTDDAPYIVYYDKTNGNLKYATNRTGSWNITTIDSIGDVGYYPSIVVESNDRSHISYYDETNGALKYAVVDDNGVYGWSINSTLPDGLEFNENTGIISGTPTQLMSSTQYTIQARNSGGVSTATISISVNDVAPGPFEYIPENNTITNNSLVHIAPSFIDTTSGNGSTWQVVTMNNPGQNFELVVNDIIYFDANQNKRLYAFNPANYTTWQVNSSLTGVGEHMAFAIDDVLYFSAIGASLGNEFWAYNTTNDTAWQVIDINPGTGSGGGSSNPGRWLAEMSGELIFFRAYTGSAWSLHVFNASNQTVWEVSHSFSTQFGFSGTSKLLSKAIGDTLYFAAKDASSSHYEPYAYTVSNNTVWMLADIYSGSASYGTEAGHNLAGIVNDILLFDAWDGSGSRTLWAHDPSNGTTWEISSSDSTRSDGFISANDCGHDSDNRLRVFVYGDTGYFCASGSGDGDELWAYNTSNTTAWLVADINPAGNSDPGQYMFERVGDTLYFSATNGSTHGTGIWAHDTSNHSTWFVAELVSPGQRSSLVVGDTVYFSADGGSGTEPWAYDTSNATTWRVADIRSGSSSSNPGLYLDFTLVSDVIYFDAEDGTSVGLWGHRPSVINYQTNTGGDVTSWAINASLPSGLSFGTNNGTVYGTPTELWTQTSYLVWANNSGGSSVSILNITVVDEVPTLSYSPSTLEFTNNTAHVAVPLDATLTGSGTIISWAINGTLPNGINFGTSNGTIWGTPTELWNSTIYTVWANNSGGSTSTTITISVVDQLPGLNISPENTTATNNTAITTIVITTVGSGEIDTWELEGELPDGLTWTSANQTIWGTPTELMTTTQYTVWANNTGGSVSATLNITVNDRVPGPFEYNPENNTWTNNTEVHLAPQFINQTTGNGSIWQVADIMGPTPGSKPGQNMEIVVGDIIYFGADDGSTGIELWAHNTSNATTWQVADIRSGSSSSNPGSNMMKVINGVLYFNAVATGGQELWKHDPSTGTTARVYDINPGSSGSSVGMRMSKVVGDVLYFSANDGSSGHELWAYNPSNSSNPWRVMDINSGSGSSNPGHWLETLVGDTLYFSADDGSTGHELWAHDTSNHSTWQVTDIYGGSGDGNPGRYMQILVGDTIYFSAFDFSTGDELWAHDTSNGSTWRVADIHTGTPGSEPGMYMSLLVGDTIYFDAAALGGTELWAHDISNHSTWRVVDIYTGSIGSDPGDEMALLVGDTLYFSATDGSTGTELWAHDTSNHSTWRVADIRGALGTPTSSYPGQYMGLLIGDTLYFSATDGGTGYELWAHDTSNHSTWQASDIRSGSSGSNPGQYMGLLIGDTLYFSAMDGSTGHELWAYRPSIIDYNTNTGGAVTSWAINASLPSGVSFGNNNGTIYGTPTELWTQTSYMVWANNSGGSSVAYLNITVNDQVPGLNISPENTTATNNTAITTIVITTVGPGEIDTWELEGTLPSGLTWTSANQTIWGTPTELMTTTQYTVWANNTGGSVSATLNITVNDQVPGLNISPENTTATNNTAITTIVITTVGPGEIDTWELEGTLPTGLTWTSANQTIWGAPTELMTTTQYTVWANNTGGSVSATLNITVNDQVPGLNISPENTTATNNTAISTITITTVGPGEIDTWELEGTLPTGLTWTSANQTIWGTPTELITTIQYTVWANNSGGAISSTFNITVNDQLPGLNISPENTTATNNTAITTIVITTVGLGEITSWELEGSLPSGLTWTPANQSIWGTPTELMTVKEYTVWANNSGGSVSANLNITVNDQLPNSLTITPENTTATNNTAITTITITTVGSGEIVTWELEGSLPSGLTWTPANQSIWGTPTALIPTTQFTVWANNSGGTVSATLNITVNDQVPTLSYPTNTLNLIVNTTSSDIPLVPILTGPGEITSWEINGSQWPPGLYFEGSNGTIMGMPNGTMSSTTFTVWANNSGGSTSTTVTIVIVDQVPTSLTISPENTTATNNSAIIPIVISSNGPGQIITWELEGTLPVGLTFTSSNQTIWGVPTELMTNSQYTIWANNTGGSVSATLNITVEDQVPGLNISPVNTTATNNTAIAPIVITSTGPGEIVTWELEGTLPSGLTWTSANQTIWGTPTELWPMTNYTVWANNSGGSVSEILNITVNDQVPGLNISPENTTATNNTAITPIIITSTGPGDIVTWELEGTLPSGLTWTSANQTIWGTPAELMSPAQYTIWANNSGGSVFATLNITVNDQVPTSLTFLNSSIVLTNNTAMIPEEASLTGPGQILTWEINGTLPSGIEFGSNNGTIWGTPTELWTMTNYTIWANNTGGSISIQIHLSVVDQLPTINYDYTSLVLTNNTADSRLPLNPTITGAGEILTWQISGALPNGLVFSSSNGSLYGTPVELWTSTSYTVWANNSGGYRTFSLTLAVIDQVPTNIVYDGGSILLTNNTVMTPEPPSITGPGEITSWEINGTLPSGVNLDSNTGIISGTPTELWPVQTYTVWANNSGGSVEFTFDLTVIAQEPDVTIPATSLSLTVGQSMSPLLPSSDGGEVVSWEIEPGLPDGLSMDSVTGEISGTPTTPQSTESYTIWANNTGGSVTQTLTITIVDVPATPSISITEITLTIDEVMAPFTITIDGGEVVEWGLHPELPLGLTFNEETGSISGIPTVLSVEQTYTIWANNSGGSQSVSFTIEVVDEPPIIEYIEEEFVLYANVTEVSIEAISSGGDVIGFSVSPELDNGLQFSETNGTIWGIPDTPHERMSFTVTAMNSGGSSASTINITVLPSVGCTDYLAENYDPIAIEDDDSCVYTDTDGDGVPDINEVFGCTDPHAFNHNASATEDDDSCIAVLEVVYPEVRLNLTVNESVVAMIPTVYNQTVETWTIEPELPDGLEFNRLIQNGVLVLDKGTIQGVPTEAIASSIFTVTATDSDTGQTSIVVLLISIIDPNAIIENETLTAEPVTDTDGDGFEDEFEEFCGSDPVDSSSIPQSQNSETCRAAISTENLEDPPGNLILWFLLPLLILILIALYTMIFLIRSKEEEKEPEN